MLRARRWHKKSPSGECARAGSGRIKYGRLSSEDAQAGGASVRLPWLLYFTLRVGRAGRQGGRNWLQRAEPGLSASAGDYTIFIRMQASQCGTASVADAPRVCALQTNGCGCTMYMNRIFWPSTKKFSLSLSQLLAARALSRLSRLSRAFRSPYLVTVEFTHTL